MRPLILIVMAIVFAMFSFRTLYQFTIKGKVVDNQGIAIAGVQVREKGNTNTTRTDPSGNFSLQVGSETAILVFKAGGFLEEERRLTAGKILVIKLTPSGQQKEEQVSRTVKEMPAPVAGIYSQPQAMVQYKSRGYMNTGSYRARILNQTAIDHRSRSNGPIYDTTVFNTEDYDAITENRFLSVKDHALSTFSIDVDAASYSNIRRYLQMNQLPPAGSVRIEEMINYFRYEYPKPLNDLPFSISTEMSACPWNPTHRLVLIGLQGRKIPAVNLPPSNLVFLIDVSGSMQDDNKLPLVRASMKLLVDQLREQDRVSIVVYAGNSGVVLPPTSGAEKIKIKDAVDRLEAGGPTAGGEGIRLAYSTAKNNFIKNGNNRVILCTDGDFNVGVSSDAELERLIEDERKTGVFLTVLGYGMGNYKDNKMQRLADKGNGNHAYIDRLDEARKVLVNEFGSTLFTIVKDVKLQVEFNPAKVQAYRLIGYENRMLSKEDFNNDRKDAGELGSGHCVTALYEVIPEGITNEFLDRVDPLKYQHVKPPVTPLLNNSSELMTIKFRYKNPDMDTSRMIEHAVIDRHTALPNTSVDFRFAAAVAEFGMLLRNSEFRQSSSYAQVRQLARESLGNDEEGYRGEFLQLITLAQTLASK